MIHVIHNIGCFHPHNENFDVLCLYSSISIAKSMQYNLTIEFNDISIPSGIVIIHLKSIAMCTEKKALISDQTKSRISF